MSPTQIEELKAENEKLQIENHNQRHEIRMLEEQIILLNHRIFGAKSEKLAADEGPGLFNEAEVQAADTRQIPEKETITYVRKKSDKSGRKAIADTIPRERIEIDIPESEKVCACGQAMTRIGEEVSEKLRYEPAKIAVEQTVRPKYACKACEGVKSEGIHPTVKIAPVPPSILPRTIAPEGLLTYILISKFCDGLPFYRQEKIIGRIGINLPRETMCRWTVTAHKKCDILFECMHEELLQSYYIGIDETRVQVLKEPDKKPEATSWMWVYRGVTNNRVILIFQYDPSRSGQVPDDYLKNYKGRIQADGYGGYNRLARSPDITRYGCFAHARRRFLEAVKTGSRGELTDQFLEWIGQLYRIENELREKQAPPGRVLYVRTKEAIPILIKIKNLALANIDLVPPSLNLGKALSYLLSEWENLERYASDGIVSIDNNLVENSIRPFAVGRRNWLFYDTQSGVKASAGFYSLIETAKANGIEPYSYLEFIFHQVPLCKSKEDFRKLLPQFVDKASIRAYQPPG